MRALFQVFWSAAPDLDLIVFKLPFELLFEIFSHLNDHRDFFKGNPHVGMFLRRMEKGHVERSTVIRNLTMTCRPLREVLLPVLWKDVEGCTVSSYVFKNSTYGLYAQCEYLISNPMVASYVQFVSLPFCQKKNNT
jgi:hypothetical protein